MTLPNLFTFEGGRIIAMKFKRTRIFSLWIMFSLPSPSSYLSLPTNKHKSVMRILVLISDSQGRNAFVAVV